MIRQYSEHLSNEFEVRRINQVLVAVGGDSSYRLDKAKDFILWLVTNTVQSIQTIGKVVSCNLEQDQSIPIDLMYSNFGVDVSKHTRLE